MNDCFRTTGIGIPALESLSEEERVWMVRLAIAQLPARDRETIFALYYDDLTEADVAKRYRVCRGAIYWRLQSIKKRLRFRVNALLKEFES